MLTSGTFSASLTSLSVLMWVRAITYSQPKQIGTSWIYVTLCIFFIYIWCTFILLKLLRNHGGSVHIVCVVDVVLVQDRHGVQPLPLYEADEANLAAAMLHNVIDLSATQWLATLGVDNIGDDPGKVRLLPQLRKTIKAMIWRLIIMIYLFGI